MNLSLKLACLLNRTSFAEVPSIFKFRGLVLTTRIALGSKRLCSTSTEMEKSGKLKKSLRVESSQAENVSFQENVVKRTGGSKNENEILEGSHVALEKMTVQQLRLKLRSLGIPAKGSKHDLLSTLKSALESKVDGIGEATTQAVDDEIFTGVEEECSPSYSKSKANSSSQNINAALENHVLKKVESMVERASAGASTIEVKGRVHKSRQKMSVITNEVSGKKPSCAKRKVALISASEDLVASDTAVVLTNQSEPWTVLAHKKPQKGWIPYNPKSMRPPPPSNVEHTKLMSWNVNGLRALMKSEGFSVLELAQRENFDVLCLQETKLQEKNVEAIKTTFLEGYANSFWTCSVAKLGYSGTAIISRIKPLSVRYGLGIADHDGEGRLVTAEFESFYLLCGYVPNSGDGLKRLSYRVAEWDPSLGSYMKELEKSKPVILTGDLNCAHQEIDIHDPAGNRRSAGFTDEERQSFETNFLSRGFVDTFRKQHPVAVAYSYWGYRHGMRRTNKGWRLDYFLVSESISDKVHDSYILPDVNGSDHCPIGLILKL